MQLHGGTLTDNLLEDISSLVRVAICSELRREGILVWRKQRDYHDASADSSEFELNEMFLQKLIPIRQACKEFIDVKFKRLSRCIRRVRLQI